MKNTSIILGILGGGQLGRMSAMAAARLGIRVVIFTDEKNAPASDVASETIVGHYDDKAKLKKFAAKVDVISYEFENIPAETVRYLRTLKPVYPDERLLEVSQDRLKEKAFLNRIGIPTARWAEAKNPKDVAKTLQKWGSRGCILKTTRFGYDGKGQYLCRKPADVSVAFQKLAGHILIIEDLIDFKCEISVIVARDHAGKMAVYGPMLNDHRHHILHTTTFPSKIAPALAKKAVHAAQTLATKVGLRGVLALEMFVTRDGQILANEIAPRTHNSGHWTIDCCGVSQFEQHVRTVCGLSVGSAAHHSEGVMLNLIGDDIQKIPSYLKKPGACVHDYGKHEAKPGRKMGHVNFVKMK
jgi:5-(carboxyamino)imidazole ribonucleotide synthase